MSTNMAELKKININKLSITTFYDFRARSSFCWKYFGNLVLCDLNKKTVLNPDHVYCSACLSAVRAESGNVSFGSWVFQSAFLPSYVGQNMQMNSPYVWRAGASQWRDGTPPLRVAGQRGVTTNQTAAPRPPAPRSLLSLLSSICDVTH